MSQKEPKAAIAAKAPDTQEVLRGIDTQQWMATLAWVSEDWLEADKLLIELGYPTQHDNGRIYPMAERVRDFCVTNGLDIEEFLRHWQERTKDKQHDI